MSIDDRTVFLNDDIRLTALRSFHILDTPTEQAFDDIVEAASAFCMAPIALVSLVDADRQWFKACLGLNVRQTPVDQAVCAIAIRQSDPLVIPDLALDPRTSGNPLVTQGPRIRFYAGAPLITSDGHALGTLCVIDTVPRPAGLSAGQVRGLGALARQVTHLIEMREAVVERDMSIVEHRKAREAARARDLRATTAQEAGRIGTFELNVITDRAFLSPEFCRLIGIPQTQFCQFADIEAYMVTDGGNDHSTAATRRDGSAPLDVEYRIRRPSDGEVRWLSRRAGFEYEGGQVVRMFGTIHDVTERRIAQQRVAALLHLGDHVRDVETTAQLTAIISSLLRRELQADRVGYAVIDNNTGSFLVECDSVSDRLDSLAGRHPTAPFAVTVALLKSGLPFAIDDVGADPELGEDAQTYLAMGAHAVINVPLSVKGVLVGVLFVHQAGARGWTPAEVEFAQGVADRAYATIARIEAVEQRNILNQELSHRMKNMLTMVQAIARQTLKGVTERDAVTSFDQRLLALSSAHDVLLQGSVLAAPLALTAERVLAAMGVGDRIDLAGPPITFGPRATLALSLLLHELGTNALKYGALSAHEGRVALTWSVEGFGDAAILTLRWAEQGGPPAMEVGRKGFGSRLIGMGLLGTGGATIRYRDIGLVAEFTASLERANAE